MVTDSKKINFRNNKIFILFIILSAIIYNFPTIITYGPRSIHQWRQADCLSITSNYYEEGMRFFYPSVNWIGAKGDGKTVSEFPIIYYFVAFLWKLFGKHEFIFRIINLSIVYIGLFYFFKLLNKLFDSNYWSIAITTFLFTSPILVFYANNFLVNAPAFALVLPGWYFFYLFYKDDKLKYLCFSMCFFLFAGLLKISTMISFFTISILFITEFIGIFKLKGELNVFKNPKKQVFPFLFVLIFILSWYLFAMYYNSRHISGIFLQGILPIWQVDRNRIIFLMTTLYTNLIPQFLNTFLFHLIILLFLLVLLCYKKINKILLIITICTFLSTIAYLILFFQVFDVHDYYQIDLLIFPLSVLITFLHFLKKNSFEIYNSKVTKYIFSFILFCCVYYCAVNNRIKYDSKDKLVKYSFIFDLQQKDFWNWFHWDYNQTLKSYESVTPYLRSIGLKRDDKVISIPDQSINITLYFMDQKGFTDFGYSELEGAARMKKFVEMGAKYLIINDKTLLDKDYMKPYLKTKIGEYKNILIYDLRNL